MAAEASKSDSQEARRIILGEKLNELLNLVHLMVKCGVENEVQTVDTEVPKGKLEGQPLTNTDLPPQSPPKPEENEYQFAKKVSKVDSKIEDLKQKDKFTLSLNSIGSTNFSSMSWFPNLTVPHGFKTPEFEKFSGNGDHVLHLQMYCETMAPYGGNEPFFIMTFQESLSNHVTTWFLQLKGITHWKGLTDAFLAQYFFNTESAPDCLDLQRMERKSGEALDPGDQGDTIDSHSDVDGHSLKNNEESKKRVQSSINRVVI